MALLALNILEADPEHPYEAWGSSQHLHTAIESLRLAFADGLSHNADHRHVKVPVFGMGDKQYAARRRKNNFKPQKVITLPTGDSVTLRLHFICPCSADKCLREVLCEQ